MIRLNKAIADSGYCARRKADELITQGRVKVNGQIVTEMGTKVDPAKDKIVVDGQRLTAAEKVYLLLHKPVGYVTSRRAGKNQRTFYDLLPEELHTVDAAGRLDQDSSGALILSSDGDFIYRITHPSFHLTKVYEIALDRFLEPDDLERLKTGVKLMPENKRAMMTKVLALKGDEPRYQVELITGYNRQIRRTLIELGYRVKTLRRISFGPVKLKNLAVGDSRPLSEAEKQGLLETAAPEKGQNAPQNKDGKVKKRTEQ